MSADGSILNIDGKKRNNVPKVKGVHPFGSSILIENLNPDEILGTDLIINDDAEIDGAPQAYVLELGPKLPENSGIKIGDRIVIQGSFIPVINTEKNNRVRGVIELHNIKAIVEER